MANKPVQGVRIPVKLPWKGATDNKDQFVSIKEPVAKALKFDKATRADLVYEVEVNKKDKSDGTKVTGQTTVKRRRRPGYRQRGVRVVFQTGGTGSGTNKVPTVGKQIKVGSSSYKSLQFPITSSVPIEEVIAYFETGAGSGLNALKIVEVNTGQSYPVIKK